MIEKIPDLPDHVLGLTAKGTVTAADYETVVVPAVEELFSRHPKVSLLYHLGEDLTGFEAGAMWADTKLGLRHLTGWQRVAVVSDAEWIRGAVRVFGLAIPGEVRVFHDRELDEAERWVAGAEGEGA